MSTSPFKHARSESEIQLANLHHDFSRHPHSLVSDEELESLCPPLGKSVVEEAEEEFVQLAERALSFIKTPESDAAIYSPYMQSPPPPDSHESDNNPYFRQAHLLASSSSYYSSPSSTSTPGSSSYATSDSSVSSCDSFPPTPPSEHESTMSSSYKSSSSKSSFASRRSNAPKTIALPLPRSTKSCAMNTGFSLHDGSLLKGSKAGKLLESFDPLGSPKLRMKRSTGFAF